MSGFCMVCPENVLKMSVVYGKRRENVPKHDHDVVLQIKDLPQIEISILGDQT